MGPRSLPYGKGNSRPSTVWPMSIVAKRSPISATAEHCKPRPVYFALVAMLLHNNESASAAVATRRKIVNEHDNHSRLNPAVNSHHANNHHTAACPLNCRRHSSGLTEAAQLLNSTRQSDILLTTTHNGSRGKHDYRVNGEGRARYGEGGCELGAKRSANRQPTDRRTG